MTETSRELLVLDTLVRDLGDLDSYVPQRGNRYPILEKITQLVERKVESYRCPGECCYNIPGWKPERVWSYSMLQFVADSQYGSLAEFALLFWNYCTQILNGGHKSYWYHRWASDGNREDDIYAHIHLEEYYNEFMDTIADGVLPLTEFQFDILKQGKKILAGFCSKLELTTGRTVCRRIADERGKIYENEESEDTYIEPTEWCMEQWSWLDQDFRNIELVLLEIVEAYIRQRVVNRSAIMGGL